ncbi:MAG: methyltransferase domain-containing protein [Candidatus Paceibacterota bacterium]
MKKINDACSSVDYVRNLDELGENPVGNKKLWLRGFKSPLTLEQVLAINGKMWKRYMTTVYKYLTGTKDSYGKGIEPTPAYKKLIEDFDSILDARDGEAWVDLCCGQGNVSKRLLSKVGAQGTVHASDIMPDLPLSLKEDRRVKIKYFDVCMGFDCIQDSSVDGFASNMGFVYAIYFLYNGQKYMGKKAFQLILAELFKKLKSGGRLIFSSPKKNTNFVKVFTASIRHMLNVAGWIKDGNIRPITGLRILLFALKIAYFGRIGMFHLYSEEEFMEMLSVIGFTNIQTKYSFAGQDLIIRAVKP